jgi:hypothetical protein
MVVAVWLSCMAWLLRFEAFPEWFVHEIPGYRSLISGKPSVIDTWMKITMEGAHIGYSHTSVDVNDEASHDEIIIHNRTLLKLLIMGERQRVKITSGAVLDGGYGMQSFDFAMSAGKYTVEVEGKHLGNREYLVETHSAGLDVKKRVKIPKDAVIYSPYLEMVLKDLKPGQETKLKIFDPLLLETSDVLIKAIAYENMTILGEEQEVLELLINLKEMAIKAWMDKEGRVIRQETPFGWHMVACAQNEAIQIDPNEFAQVDMLEHSGVPVNGEIGERTAKVVRHLRLSGLDYALTDMPGLERQEILASGEDFVDLRISSEPPPPQPSNLAIPADVRPYLAATTYIQSDHPDLIKRAKSIVGSSKDPEEQAMKLYHWVHQKVQKFPTVSLPSALDVLKNMEGDCNEHTYLYVGLARAAGIPSAVRVGIMYVDGFFGYHAWPAIYVNGRWLDIDPTLGQEIADSTHIILITGEIESQMELVRYLGKLKIDVLPGDQP